MLRPAPLTTLLVAVAAVAALATAGCMTASPDQSRPASAGQNTPPVATSSPPVSPTPAIETPSPSASPSGPPTAPALAAVNLKMGSSGVAVTQLQQRLTDLGYWVGTPDGHFGTATQQAVFAVQKAAGIGRSGTVNAATRAALTAGKRPTAKSRSGHVIEVDLKRDLLLFTTNGHVDYILNTSTGGGYVYYDQGERDVAITPKGHFKTYRVIDGPHRSSLGLLFRPRYFTRGFAIHGDSSVPAHPASHGCVRVTDAAINWIWATKLDPIGTGVYIY